MKIIWTFTLLMIPGVVSAMSVTGYAGGGVKFTCKYDEENKGNEKYFCRKNKDILAIGWCSDLIKTHGFHSERKDRFSLYDDRSSSVFTVTIRDLREEDSDTYYCAVDKTIFKDSYTEVNLRVLTGQQNMTVSGYSGGNVTINFKYEIQEENPVIDVCKTADQCFTVINTNRRAEWKHDRRFSVYNDRSAGLLLLFIRDLNENDSGEYKIIVKVSEDYSFFSEFNLDIKKVPEKTTPSSSPSSSSSSTSSPTSPRPSSSSSSASSSSSVKTSPFTGVSRTSTSLASPMTSPGSSLIVPLVLVLLVLIIAGLLLLFLCKKYQSQGGDSSSQTGPGKHEVVSHTGCDYEEIKDTHKQLPTNPSDSSDTFYATAQLPTNPSDSSDTFYATAQLPTNPSDSPNTVYASAQLPTNPSDSSNTVYASAQLPTNPSDSSNTVYASAQLPTNPSDSSNTVYASAQLPTSPSDSSNTVYATCNK
ncbi:unnamed protein product [Leuciscus chuanchicus]